MKHDIKTQFSQKILILVKYSLSQKIILSNTALSDMHSIEKSMLIHTLWFLNYGLVQVTRIFTFYQIYKIYKSQKLKINWRTR